MTTSLSQFDLLLAEVQRMRDEHALLQQENERLKQQVAPVPSPTPAPAPVPVAYPVGTKYLWSDRAEKDDMLCRRVTAIQLKNGVLQVKDRTSGKTDQGHWYGDGTKYDLTKKFYESLDAWKASLPEGFTTVESSDGLSELQRRLKMPFPRDPIAKGDCDALRIFCKRWKVYGRAVEGYSYAEDLESSKSAFRELQHRVAYIPTANNYDPVAARNTLASINALRSYYQKIRYLEEKVKNLTNNELHEKPIRMKWSNYTAKLYAYVQGQRHLIVPSDNCKPDFMWCNGRRGKTFAELGIDLKPDGTPLLTLFYRTNTYEF